MFAKLPNGNKKLVLVSGFCVVVHVAFGHHEPSCCGLLFPGTVSGSPRNLEEKVLRLAVPHVYKVNCNNHCAVGSRPFGIGGWSTVPRLQVPK